VTDAERVQAPSRLGHPIPPANRQAGITADDGRQLRSFPRALRLDDLLVEPDESSRGDSIPNPETTKETPTPAKRELLTIKQLVAYSTLSERTLRTYLKRRVQPLPHYRVDKKILIRRSEFDEWLANFRRADGGDGATNMVEEILGGLTKPSAQANTRAQLKSLPASRRE
jgi:hypothetical protein